MAKLSSLKAAFRQKKGFSLIAVMIISLINLAIMGVALRFAVSSSGGGRVNSAMAMKYNLLQNALEEGKARLKKSMDKKRLPHKYTDKYTDGNVPDITSPDILLLPRWDGDLELGEKTVMSWDNRAEMKRLGIFGDSGELTVKIYDMQYDATKVIPEEIGEDLRLLPPSMPLNVTGNNASEVLGTTDGPDEGSGSMYSGSSDTGDPDDDDDKGGVYLIRAALTVKDAEETPIHTWSLETSVIQYNNQQQQQQ